MGLPPNFHDWLAGKTDAELLAASKRPHEYFPESFNEMRAEMERRGLPVADIPVQKKPGEKVRKVRSISVKVRALFFAQVAAVLATIGDGIAAIMLFAQKEMLLGLAILLIGIPIGIGLVITFGLAARLVDTE